MASAFLSSILSKTSQVFGCVRSWAVSPSSSSDPRSSVLEDLKELEKTLRRIQVVLHDAEEREIRDESVKLWLKELKEVAYEADDVLDEYQYEVLRAQVEGRASHKRKRVEGDDEEEVSIPDGMGYRIRKIRESFDKISQDRESLHLRGEDGERRVLETPYPEPTSHMVDESSIYGRDGDKQEVIDLLFSEGVGDSGKGDKQEVIDLLFSKGVGNGVSVIPIVGKGGLGKTTIAQLVYNDSNVIQYFDLIGWVCVSNDFDVRRLTKDIIESLTQSSCDLTLLSTLQDTLKKKVKGKRVLLVLDDVWNDQLSRWERVLLPFVDAKTVRIIVTCRNDSVAEIMQTVCPYHPRCLSPEQSWALFRHYAFGGRDPKEQPHLVDMGKQIVKKCSGLPLAVKSIGSLLRYTTDEDSWMDVIQSDIWEVDENNEILPALRLSYSRMPAHLKPCFVYCSMFPKDYEFDKDELVQLWMAQGYIQTTGGRRRLEDIGNEYFNDLQRRSFFDSSCDDYKMHDMIHDLAKSIAGNECWAIVDKKLPGLPDEVRHLYVEDKKEFVKSLRSYNFSALRTLLIQDDCIDQIVIPEIIKNLSRLRCLRTLLFFGERKDEIPDLFGNLKHLRHLRIRSEYIEKVPESVCLLYHVQILELDCENLAELPDGLGNLTNLRSFNLFAHCIKRLPETVCQLCNLQMLVLDGCTDLEELPSGIGSLTSLRHLYGRDTRILCLPAGIEKLTNLQSLLGCYKVQGGIGVLKDLVNLQGFLSISGLRNLVNIENTRDADLKHKQKLKELMLAWNAVDCKNDPYHEHHYGLQHLEVFLEENKDVPADEKREEAMLECLQPHANLEKLLINGYGGSKFPEWVGDPFSFASLRDIDIINCEKIRSLPLYIHDSLEKLDAPISTSMLIRVYISGCRQLTSIAGLHHLHSLKCLIIRNCPKLQIMEEDQPLSVPCKVKIVDCPGLSNWCQIQRINYIQVASGNKMTISNTWENIMHGFADLTSIEYLCFSNSWEFFLETDSIPILEELTVWGCTDIPPPKCWDKLTSLRSLVIKDCPGVRVLQDELLPPTLNNSREPFWRRDSILEELTIWGCTDIPPLRCLPKLTSLRSLVIKYCPGVQVLQDELLPSMLKSLVVDSCEELRDLRLAQLYRDAFEELQLVNCPKLERVRGLNFIFFPKILRIEQCPQLWFPSIPPGVEIAEETENKETIDDGTQEKQVSDCVKTEHTNNAVSSIFDAADDCNMGQFLQQMITAEPSHFAHQKQQSEERGDNSVVSPISDDATDFNISQFLQLGSPSGCSSQSPIHNNAEPSN